MNSSSIIEHRVKIILLGDSAVGKTSFIECFKEGPNAARTTIPTITGPEYVSHKFQVNDGTVLKVNIWDTAGQEAFRAMNKTFYKESKGALILVDLSQLPKKESLEYWYNEFKAHVDDNSQIMLVGNKADLDKESETVAMLEEFSNQKQIPFIEVSALTGFNVDLAMQNLITLIYEKYYKDLENSFDSSQSEPQKREEYNSSIHLQKKSVRSNRQSENGKSSCCGSL